jgi:hypothetical protein
MKYLLLVYVNEQEWESLSPTERQRLMDNGGQYSAELKAAKKYISGSQLQPVSTATCVRKGSDGKVMITDGPFAETREQLGGYALVEAKDLEEAIAMAKRFHGGGPATIEVRPQMPGGDA